MIRVRPLIAVVFAAAILSAGGALAGRRRHAPPPPPQEEIPVDEDILDANPTVDPYATPPATDNALQAPAADDEFREEVSDTAAPPPPTGAEPDLENLRSLPYGAWTTEPAEKKNAEGAEERRKKAGVVLHDVERAAPGYNLFTDMGQRIFLMDNDGNVVHKWVLKSGRCTYAHLFPNGDLIAMCGGTGLWKVDKDSKVLWFHRLPGVNHDVDVMKNGDIVVSLNQGTTTYLNRRVYMDGIGVFSGEDGHELRRWNSFGPEGPKLLKFHGPTRLDAPALSTSPAKYDYYHLNSVQELPPTDLGERDPRFAAGNLMVSFRNTSTVAVMDPNTFDVLWAWGWKKLDNQHMPYLLDNGHILVFDNGLLRHKTKVLEVNPENLKIVWRYPPRKSQLKLNSPTRGNAQRLPNGNTLICEADRGHAFEVNRVGDTVWEYFSPPVGLHRLAIYRMWRVTDIDPSTFATGKPVPITDFFRATAPAAP